jgi:hypothetical protein
MSQQRHSPEFKDEAARLPALDSSTACLPSQLSVVQNRDGGGVLGEGLTFPWF